MPDVLMLMGGGRLRFCWTFVFSSDKFLVLPEKVPLVVSCSAVKLASSHTSHLVMMATSVLAMDATRRSGPCSIITSTKGVDEKVLNIQNMTLEFCWSTSSR